MAHSAGCVCYDGVSCRTTVPGSDRRAQQLGPCGVSYAWQLGVVCHVDMLEVAQVAIILEVDVAAEGVELAACTAEVRQALCWRYFSPIAPTAKPPPRGVQGLGVHGVHGLGVRVGSAAISAAGAQGAEDW